jgi:hypothetical protein
MVSRDSDSGSSKEPDSGSEIDSDRSKQKRHRTRFTPAQLNELERNFANYKKLCYSRVYFEK